MRFQARTWAVHRTGDQRGATTDGGDEERHDRHQGRDTSLLVGADPTASRPPASEPSATISNQTRPTVPTRPRFAAGSLGTGVVTLEPAGEVGERADPVLGDREHELVELQVRTPRSRSACGSPTNEPRACRLRLVP